MKRSKIYCLLYLLCTCVQALGFTENPRDLQTTRANTLMDDADDIQKQLENEARSKMSYGRPPTIWIFHIPVPVDPTRPIVREQRDDGCMLFKKDIVEEEKGDDINIPLYWDYKGQDKWSKAFPECGGHSQSPVNLPYDTLQHANGARKMLFANYDVKPKFMTLVNDGKTLSLIGEWPENQRPLIYGGAAHSRRYLFHSLVFHWPSEHMIAGLKYPLESQAIHVSAEYHTIEDATKAVQRDKMAILTVANIYVYANHNQKGLPDLLTMSLTLSYGNQSAYAVPLSAYSPPLTEYAAYHGSLTTPPCTETVLWLVRARSLPITRAFMETLEESGPFALEPGQLFFRMPQPLNDRLVYYFK